MCGMQTSRTESYVFLVRHAERTGSWEKEEEEYPIANRFATPDPGTSEYWTTPGAPKAYALAGVLCDRLKKEKTAITHIIHSDHKIARQTADIFSEVLEKRQGSSLEPSCCEHLVAEDIADDETKQVVEKFRSSSENSTTYLVVGHQPQLTQIAES